MAFKKIRTFPILNYDEYDKEKVKKLLEQELGWQPYPNKHGESIYTRFFQEYYLPEKFGFDKRKLHLSSLVASGQLSRDEALRELSKPLYDAKSLEEEIEYVEKKLGFTHAEWLALMSKEKRFYMEFPNRSWLFNYDNPVIQFIREVGKGQRDILNKK